MTLKRDPILVALGNRQELWDAFLLNNYGLPQEPQPRYEVSESAFVDEDGSRSTLEGLAGRQIRLGEEPPKGLFKVRAEYSGPENEASAQWKRSQAFVRIVAWIYTCEKRLPKLKRDEFLKYVDDLKPTSPLPVFEESLGTPEEFLGRWRCYELDVRFVRKSRADQIIEIRFRTLPPDVPEDLPEADEPSGHWGRAEVDTRPAAEKKFLVLGL